MGKMIYRLNLSLGLLMAFTLLLAQGGRVSASSAGQNPLPVSGVVQSLTLETDATTGVTTVIVDVIDDNDLSQPFRVSLKTAFSLGLVVLNEEGGPGINYSALGKPVEINPRNIIPDQPVTQHPVGSALATFFSDIPGMDYETIMNAHQQGVGFGVIAQTLWLTTKLEGDSGVFEAILHAKQTGDYSAFILDDGSSPQNWGQLRKAILNNDRKNSLGVILSGSGSNGNGTGNDKEDNGAGNGNEHNGEGDKEKDKEKDKNPDPGKDSDPGKDNDPGKDKKK